MIDQVTGVGAATSGATTGGASSPISTWTGIAIGGLLGGIIVWAISKKVSGTADVGVVGAAVGAGALIGGALTAPKPAG